MLLLNLQDKMFPSLWFFFFFLPAGFLLQDHEAITGLLGIINQYCHTYKAPNFTLYFHFNRGPAAEQAVRNAKAG